MRKFALILLVTVSLAAQPELLAQEQQQEPTSKKDSVAYDFIFLGGKYQNKFTFLGRDFGLTMPFASADLVYYFNCNFWLGGSVFKFYNVELPLQTSLSAGYYAEFSSKADFHISYTQFFIPDNSAISGLQTQGIAQTTFGLDWTHLYSTLQAQVLINKTPDVFFVTQHSRYFEFNQKLFNKMVHSIF
jgi:hypothetical protein